MRRLLLLGVFLFPLMLFGLGSDALAGQTDGIKGEGGRPFTTTLSGLNERPPVSSDVKGTAKVTINLGQHELCWDLDYTTTQQVIAAHIHKAATTTSGPIVVPFFNFGAPVVNSGCRSDVAPALLRAIAEDPEAYYVNVHTTAHPGGAGRGQLSK
jgi:CHRD domain-containing protein